MFESLVDAKMIVEINQTLKEKGYEYSVHSYAGCSTCGLNLKCDGKEADRQEVLQVIQSYLDTKWLIVKQNLEDPSMLYINSKFNK